MTAHSDEVIEAVAARVLAASRPADAAAAVSVVSREPLLVSFGVPGMTLAEQRTLSEDVAAALADRGTEAGSLLRARATARARMDAAYALANAYGWPFAQPEGCTVDGAAVPEGFRVHLHLEHPETTYNYMAVCEANFRRTPLGVTPEYDALVPADQTDPASPLTPCRFAFPLDGDGLPRPELIGPMFDGYSRRVSEAMTAGRRLERAFKAASTAAEYAAILAPQTPSGSSRPAGGRTTAFGGG